MKLNLHFTEETELIVSYLTLQIKSAFYSLLSGVIHSMPELANEKASKICGSVLSKLNETDPVVCASVWEAALCTVSYIKVGQLQNVD